MPPELINSAPVFSPVVILDFVHTRLNKMVLTGYRIVHVDAYSYRRKFTIKDTPDKPKKAKKKAKKAPGKRPKKAPSTGKVFVPF